MKKIIFILENFFTRRDFERYEIQFFMDNNVNIEIWDITEFSNKNFNKLIQPQDEVKDNYVKKLNSSRDIRRAFKNLKEESLFAVYISLNIRTSLVFKLLSKYQIKYFTRSGASILSHPNIGQKTLLKKIIFFLKKDPSSIFEYFQNLFFKIFTPRFFGISNIPIYFKDAQIADIKINLKKKLIGKNTKIILSHHRDYDVYLKYKNKDAKKYSTDAVFIDQNIGFHNDIRQIEIMDPYEWYKSLETFFNFLKKKYLINTTICAHPRSNGEINKLVSGYPIIKNKTAQLIKNCSFVMCQTSTALNFAVLFNKPMIFIYNHILLKNEKSQLHHASDIEFIARSFNKKPINLENLNNFNLEKELKIDQNNYKDYIAKYVNSWDSKKRQSEMIMELL